MKHWCPLWQKKIVAAFRGMHVSPAKYSYAWLPRKCDYRTDTRTDRRRTKLSLCAAMLRRRHKKGYFCFNKGYGQVLPTLVPYERVKLVVDECQIWSLFLLWFKTYDFFFLPQSHRETVKKLDPPPPPPKSIQAFFAKYVADWVKRTTYMYITFGSTFFLYLSGFITLPKYPLLLYTCKRRDK